MEREHAAGGLSEYQVRLLSLQRACLPCCCWRAALRLFLLRAQESRGCQGSGEGCSLRFRSLCAGCLDAMPCTVALPTVPTAKACSAL